MEAWMVLGDSQIYYSVDVPVSKALEYIEKRRVVLLKGSRLHIYLGR
jgi:hypothetical protein